MIERAIKLTRSPFLRSVVLLSGGNSFALLLPILAAPVLGRIYPPADYGALATYMAPMSILAMVASMQFQYAIIAERAHRSAAMVAWLSIFSAPLVGALSALVVLMLWPGVLSKSAPGLWFFLLPVMVSVSGITGAGNFLANRHRRYRWLASVQIANVVTTLIASLSLGFLGFGKHGLLIAYILGQSIHIGIGAYLLFHSDIAIPKPSRNRLIALAKRHWRYPVMSLPSETGNQLSQTLPIFALASMGAYGSLGAFTRANQLVGMPVTVVGQSIASVFRQKGAEIYNETGSCQTLIRQVAFGSFSMTLPIVLFFLLFGPWFFTLYLGPTWTEAGEIARILAPMLLLRNVAAPLANVFLFTDKQATALKIRIGLLVALLISFAWIIFSGSASALLFVYAFSIVFGGYYIVEFLLAFKAGKRK